MEPSYGQTALGTKASGATTKQTGKENSYMQMAMFTRESGSMIKQKAKALTLTQTEPTMRVIG